jgi:hypothetical protein
MRAAQLNASRSAATNYRRIIENVLDLARPAFTRSTRISPAVYSVIVRLSVTLYRTRRALRRACSK